jgi:hypothetical protein
MEPSADYFLQFVAATSMLMNLVMIIVTIIQAFRRSPPLDKELAEYLKRDHCAACKAELWARINGDKKELEAKLDAMQLASSESAKEILRAIGRLEGSRV